MTGHKSEYIIDESQPTQLDLTLAATGDIQAELTVYKPSPRSAASQKSELTDGQVEDVQLTLS